jgi:hypothetical protein
MKLSKLRELGWTSTEISRDQQAFADAFNVYIASFSNTNKDNSNANELDNELALYRITNYALESLVRASMSKVERYLSEPLIKKNDKKSYSDY